MGGFEWFKVFRCGWFYYWFGSFFWKNIGMSFGKIEKGVNWWGKIMDEVFKVFFVLFD